MATTDPSAGPASPSPAERIAAEEIAALFVTSGQPRKYAAALILPHLSALVRSVEERVWESAARLIEARGRKIGGAIDPARTAAELRGASLKETR